MRSIILTLTFILFFVQPLKAEERGPLISMELRDVSITDVLRALSQEHNINIIVDDSVSGNVTVSLRNIPLWDAIESILRSKGYTYRIIRTGLLLVEPLTDYEKKEEYVVIREFKLKYLKVSDKSVSSVNGFLSGKGQIIPVESTNSIIVKDIPQVVDKVIGLLSNMDIQPAQIMIEARIVEVSTNFSRELGINWSDTKYETGGGSSNFSVNLPASGTIGTLGFIIGSATDKFRLNVQLTALESSGKAKTVSSPKIRVLENNKAVITSGEEILTPMTTTSNGVTSTSYDTRQALLKLEVTPRAIAEGMVLMTIDTTRDEFDYARKEPGQPPPKNTRAANTQLLVRDGETIVIGGIYRKADSQRETAVPFLSKIPLLGWFFRSRAKREDQLELLIFITPTIIKETEPSGL